MDGTKCKKRIENAKNTVFCVFTTVYELLIWVVTSLYKWVIAKCGILGLDGKEIIKNLVATFCYVSISLLIVLIGIGLGPWLFGKAGYSIDYSKRITSAEAISFTMQALLAIVVLQLTSKFKDSK